MFDVIFIDSGREPECKPDPAFPDGRHIILAPNVIAKSCTRNLPYPAPRCGVYKIECVKCGFVVAVTVAGRVDDPKVITIPCKAGGLDG